MKTWTYLLCGALCLYGADAANDPNAGSWKTIVLSSVSEIPVPEPAPVTDASYQAELAALKDAQAHATEAQMETVKHWNRGGVMRWTELMLELVAKYGLPPAPRADGTYPVPDASNPLADPAFPFANPPYAARAYSYVSVAQYEALKVAWHYKFLYNRPRPSATDSEVRLALPSLDMPSYPSEDAVVAAVSSAILQFMFPASVDRIRARAAEHEQAALLSGRATSSDIEAGKALGQAVAARMLQRARTDGMGQAGGNTALWQSMADAVAARGEVAWRSLESPPRPPMLPNFGRVLTWMMTPAEIVAERSGPPPSTSSEAMRRELEEVRVTAERLTRRQLAIAAKWADGAGTPTPPGRWNLIAMPYIVDANWSEVRQARAFALLNMALHDSAVACWDTKFHYYNPRPTQMDPRIRTSIGLPNFPAYVSGHSTFSSAGAEVLSYLFPHGAGSFQADRDEAAISRLYAAIHYRADIEVGKQLGSKVGQYTVRFAQADGADQ